MVLRWTAAGFLQAEKGLRKLSGYRDLWMLQAALGRSDERVAMKAKAA
jgi:putative transposase